MRKTVCYTETQLCLPAARLHEYALNINSLPTIRNTQCAAKGKADQCRKSGKVQFFCCIIIMLLFCSHTSSIFTKAKKKDTYSIILHFTWLILFQIYFMLCYCENVSVSICDISIGHSLIKHNINIKITHLFHWIHVATWQHKHNPNTSLFLTSQKKTRYMRFVPFHQPFVSLNSTAVCNHFKMNVIASHKWSLWPATVR